MPFITQNGLDYLQWKCISNVNLINTIIMLKFDFSFLNGAYNIVRPINTKVSIVGHSQKFSHNHETNFKITRKNHQKH